MRSYLQRQFAPTSPVTQVAVGTVARAAGIDVAQASPTPQQVIDAGSQAATSIQSAAQQLGAQSQSSPLWTGITIGSVVVSAIHGVRRNNGSAFWGVAWGALGALFPVVTPAIAIGQGYGKPAAKK